MNVPDEEFAALFTCACLIQGNWPKARGVVADAAFIPGLAVDNWQGTEEDDGILATAAKLWHEKRVRCIAIPGYASSRPEDMKGLPSNTGYPGLATWRAALQTLGVGSAVLPYAGEDFGPDGKSWNTRTEIESFLRLAQKLAWCRVIVVTTPFHTLRVLLTLVKAMQRVNGVVRIRSVTPATVSWTKRVYHSQGVEQLLRHEHIAREWERIPKYQENGSICTFRELRDYLLESIGEW